MVTKDRVGALLAALAAVVGLFLVFDGRGPVDDDDDAPAGPAPTGQVVPAPGGQVQQLAPGQGQPALPTQAPADDDGDDDDG